jgi:hypothetical protein
MALTISKPPPEPPPAVLTVLTALPTPSNTLRPYQYSNDPNDSDDSNDPDDPGNPGDPDNPDNPNNPVTPIFAPDLRIERMALSPIRKEYMISKITTDLGVFEYFGGYGRILTYYKVVPVSNQLKYIITSYR